MALAANGIYNPFLLLKSGIDDGPVGRGVTEQIPIYLSVDFATAGNQGYSSLIGAVNYAFADGPHRAHASGGFLEISSRFRVRPNAGKWNRNAFAVFLAGRSERRGKPRYHRSRHAGSTLGHLPDWTSYARAGLAHVEAGIGDFLAPLGVDRITADYDKVSTHSALTPDSSSI